MNGFSPKAYNYYLYTDDLESVIKTCIWIFSAIGGIWTQQFADAQARGGAFFIFALSLMMEFAPKLKEKFGVVARIVHLIFFDSNNCDIKLFICSFIWSNITKIL